MREHYHVSVLRLARGPPLSCVVRGRDHPPRLLNIFVDTNVRNVALRLVVLCDGARVNSTIPWDLLPFDVTHTKALNLLKLLKLLRVLRLTRILSRLRFWARIRFRYVFPAAPQLSSTHFGERIIRPVGNSGP